MNETSILGVYHTPHYLINYSLHLFCVRFDDEFRCIVGMLVIVSILLCTYC